MILNSHLKKQSYSLCFKKLDLIEDFCAKTTEVLIDRFYNHSSKPF